MRFSVTTLLFCAVLSYGQDAALMFHPTGVFLVPDAPQWGPTVTEDESFYNDPMPPFSLRLLSTPVTVTTLDAGDFPPTAEAILCNISFKGTLSDNKDFSVTSPLIENHGDSIRLTFATNTLPGATQLQLKGTLRYEIRDGEGTETLPAVAINGRGEYKASGYIIHYLPDAGEGTKEHTFMVMPPDRTKKSAAAIADIIFTDKNGKKWSHSNGTLKKEEVWYTADTVCFASDEKIEADHGSLQIVLHGQAKTYSANINQSISINPAKHEIPVSTPKNVKFRHVLTEFHAVNKNNTEDEEEDTGLVMLWQQCFNPRHQQIRDSLEAEDADFITVQPQFKGSATDETGHQIPLSLDYVSCSSQGFILQLINKDALPKGLKLRVEGTLDFMVCDTRYNRKTATVLLTPEQAQTIDGYSVRWDQKDQCISIRVAEGQHADLKRICGITVDGVDYTHLQHETNAVTVYCETEPERPGSVEIQLHILNEVGQRYTGTINQVIDLSTNK